MTPTDTSFELGPMLLLVALRVFGVLRVQPVWRAGIGRMWLPVALILALLVALTSGGGAHSLEGIGLADWVMLGLWEFVLGTLVGFIASLPGLALIGAMHKSAEILATPRAPMTALGVSLALVMALGLRLHEPAIQMLVGLAYAFPMGQPDLWFVQLTRLEPALLVALPAITVLGLALVTPVLLSSAVMRLGLSALGRGPFPAQVVSEAIAPWAAAAVSLLALGASWAVYREVWASAILPTTPL